jgi:hypothetical protein
MNDYLSNYKVKDRLIFIEFINLLKQDLIEIFGSWENKSLDGGNGWSTSIGLYNIHDYNVKNKLDINADKPNWQTFVNILTGATIYE